MSDFASETMTPETSSTMLDTQLGTEASGGGAPRTLETEAKEPSLRDTISAVVKEDAKAVEEPKKDEGATEEKTDTEAAKKPEVKPDEKPADKDDPKARDETGKFTPKQGEEAQKATADEAKPGEPVKHPEPPKNFLPDSKDVWRNVPRPVRRDIENMTREFEEKEQRYQVANQRYETIRDFDELAKSNGRELRESLMKVHEIETELQKNPIAGLNKILMEVGPRKADGQPVSLFEVAQYIVQQGPQGYQQMVAQGQQQPQQPQTDPRVQQLEQQLAQMQEQQVAAQIIEPFKVDHPRYDELQDDIAFFLQSGKISPSLSPLDRLEAAYDMAVRINPPSHVDQPADEGPANPRRADDSLSGSKSIKSAPGAVSPDMEPERGGSIRDLLQDELKRVKRS
ncbi:hypothetical protein [Rhizorhapis suberifaciens]|uniref:Uncharacterized protein n=1 Tax=Rhizorhapis suberifaciens TaxID=13656 RepID=A0A840HWC2_9SPHN|nr:hypothetical protein [Rhizorhapis suberifaciens]MBB4642365.1 hypothetical protein [Rhizorhapis suberifaciens]